MPSIPEHMVGAILLGPEHIEIRELPVPRPADGELILRVRAATTCGTDVKVFRRGGHPRMLKVPTLFGHEMAGEVVALGNGVEKFSLDDRLVVANSAPCGHCDYCRVRRENLCTDLEYLNGAFAQYLCVPARFVEVSSHHIPDGLDFDKAALTEPLACVLHGLDACELARRPEGSEVVVFGAGPIGLLFTAALGRDGHRVILADPNASRLEVGMRMGAAKVQVIERDGGQASLIRAATSAGLGADVCIDCTGQPAVWRDTMEALRPGGLALLFGGCAPGTRVEMDTHHVHYSEITVKGVYHHRPDTVRRALEMLSEADFAAEHLLSDVRPIEEVEQALRAMMDKTALKVVIRNTP
ncbi:MAG: alcohol dehydrogenase catalytic domain-containing protein [Gammaproteobacteria bacterium]|nr:alcohol dehydrogenase catalytic domain-containing protein [Gammaproteobacteria bacterium]MDX2460148.1 alcohol dehydrogenase catalytic domain-containing protein [Gammaproteobacteria bacterium]